MNTQAVIDFISDWLNDYVNKSGTHGFVVGVSGGIDSAVTSSLAAGTGLPVICLEMPIHQDASQVSRARKHIESLKSRFDNVSSEHMDLTPVYEQFVQAVPAEPIFGEDPFSADSRARQASGLNDSRELSLANARARLRMTTLYYVAGMHGFLVAGTGNKVEDFGVGFYTKYGDGGVDLSPIADLMKSEVYALGAELGVISEIMQAKPTDGLWGDDRSDEDQLGASYAELEWAMEFDGDEGLLDLRQLEVLGIYRRLNQANRHKMEPIPVCIIPDSVRHLSG